MKSYFKFKFNDAFTLIELLVVISVIAVLAAILFPVFIRAREAANSVTCISNLKQLDMSLQLYIQDYDYSYPVIYFQAAQAVGDNCGELYGGHFGVSNPSQQSYIQYESIGSQLDPYNRNIQIWHCASDGGAQDAELGGGIHWSSYHYRMYLYSGFTPKACGGISGKVWREDDFPYPAQTFVFDDLWIWHDDRETQLAWLNTDCPKGQKGWDPSARMNFAFMDGHAKSEPVSDILEKASWDCGQGGMENETEVHATMLLYKAKALRRLGMSEAAKDILTIALRRTKDRSPHILLALRYERAQTCELLGLKEMARADYEKIYAEEPDYEDVATKLGLGKTNSAQNQGPA